MPHRGFTNISTEKLTDTRVKNASTGSAERAEIWDAVLPGLGLRIGKSGSKTWFVRYRFGASQRRFKIGTYPSITLVEARRMARGHLLSVAENIDPAEKHLPNQDAFKEVAADFVRRYAMQQQRRWKETERILNRYIIPNWGDRKIRSISKRDVLDLLDAIVDRGAPVMATATHAVIRKLFYWAVDREIIDVSPCIRVPKPAIPAERDRVLSDGELRAVWLACDAMQWPFGPAIRLMILTGQRENEVGGMRWAELRDSTWTIPGERTKNGRVQELPLSEVAKGIIDRLPKVDPVLVFTTTGKKPIAAFNNAKRRIDALSKVTDWHFHDLRRTAVTGMARLGVAPHIVEKVLNHQTGVISGVAAIYNRHAYTEEKLAALELWADYVSRIAAAP